MASIFCDWRSAVSALRRSATSRGDALFKGLVQSLKVLGCLLRLTARREQLAFIAAAISCVKNGDADKEQLTCFILSLYGID